MQRTGHRWLVIVSLGLLLIACVTRMSDVQNDTPRQGWWEQRGPVVPHGTFPSDCSLCHAGNEWHEIRADFEFDHATETGVELVGAHAAAECLRCHNDKGPVATFFARGCSGCHEDVHRGGFGRECSACHTEDDWRPDERITDHQVTRFPLVGAHAAAACWSCHPGAETGVFIGVDTSCEACHADDLARATDPDHLAAGFVSGCDRCHIPTAWTGAAFKHPGFPLGGGHAGLDCSECHAGGVFTGTPSDCYSCHTSDYAATTSPNHTSAGFPTTCETCHTTSSWLGASFNHSTWPLTGAHLAADCADCHAGNVYAGTPMDCFSCHATEYNNTTDPNHTSAGFPTTCESCHTTSRWEGAMFNHMFPITSGAHKNFDCSDCHTTPSNFMLFSCIDCHEHNESDMADKHDEDEITGYVWASSACYMCHPDGRH